MSPKLLARTEVLYVACRLAAADMTGMDQEVEAFDRIVHRSPMYAEAALALIEAVNDTVEAENTDPLR